MISKNQINSLLKEFAKHLDIPYCGFETIRIMGSGVFLLSEHDLIIKVHEQKKTFDEVLQEIRISKHLSSKGFPTTSVSPFLPFPVVIQNYLISAWKYAEPDNTPIDYFLLGKRVSEFQSAMISFDRPLPDFNIIEHLTNRYDRARPHLTYIESMVMDYAFFELSQYYSRHYVDLHQKGSVIHGDVHPGNAFFHNGELLLIDFEKASIGGHPYFDIASILIHHEYFGLSRKKFELFSFGADVDIEGWEHLEFAKRVRLFSSTCLLLLRRSESEEVDEEINRRIGIWTGENNGEMLRNF